MKVVSLVPSWTETLIECGVRVVGRTRYCIHPKDRVKDIPIVGGTKSISWNKMQAIQPHLVVFDKEENTKEMARSCPYPWVTSHITNINSVPHELRRLSSAVQCNPLADLADEWSQTINLVRSLHKNKPALGPPGITQWIKKPTTPPKNIIYLIWRKPWMTIQPNTFIGSVLALLGWQQQLIQFPDESLYPQIHLPDYINDQTLLLFSTEPYPFAKKLSEIASLNAPSALIDGEAYGWFGMRSLRFLQSQLN